MPTCEDEVVQIIHQANADALVARLAERPDDVPLVKDVVDKICILLAKRIDVLENCQHPECPHQ